MAIIFQTIMKGFVLGNCMNCERDEKETFLIIMLLKSDPLYKWFLTNWEFWF